MSDRTPSAPAPAAVAAVVTPATAALPPATVGAWRRLFVNRSQPYAEQQPDGTYRWRYAECTPALLAAHLRGEVTLALSSTDARGWAKWACLDCDSQAPDALPRLLALRAALAGLGLPGLVEASRRGGHLWLLLRRAVPAVELRYAVRSALDELRAGGVDVPPVELYPDASEAGALGHAVRLPLGVHRLTGTRYPPFDADGLPCAFSSPAAAARFVLRQPRVTAAAVGARWRRFAEEAPPAAATCAPALAPAALATLPPEAGKVGTRSAVIRWVDAHVDALELLADLAPETQMRRVGRGYLGWCPFHDDRASDDAGRPGTPSFYVVRDRRYSWSWRCLSTNCPQSWGLMRHTFELLQRALGLTPRSAIVEACQRWPAADARGAADAPQAEEEGDADADHD